jgi:hypothetical protein
MMNKRRLLNNPTFPMFAMALNHIIEQEEQEIARKLEGIDIEQEYHKIQNKKSCLSKSMRELVVREYGRRKRADSENDS